MASAEVEEAEDTHRATVLRARRELEPRVRAALEPRARDVVTAFAAVREKLDALAADVARATELGVSAPAPTVVASMMNQFTRALTEYMAGPAVPTLPPGTVLVRVASAFRLSPGGQLDANQQTGAGAVMMAGDTCAVAGELADALITAGKAEPA